jgi:WD40 repeat protein
VERSEPREVLRGHGDKVQALAFADDGKTLASGSHDMTVRLWGAVSGLERGTLKGHYGPVLAVAFAPGARVLASAGQDRTIRLWRAAGEAEVQAREG